MQPALGEIERGARRPACRLHSSTAFIGRQRRKLLLEYRVHFGIGLAQKVDLLEIPRPSGQTDSLKDLKANQLYYVTEGKGVTRAESFSNRS